MEIVSHLSIPVLAALLALELGWCAYTRRSVHHAHDSASNLTNGLIYVIFGMFFFPLIYALYTEIFAHRLFDLPRTLVMFGVLLLADDFINYWVHRLLHVNRFFWAVHESHHSSEEFNFTTGTRLAVATALTIWPFWAILPWLGFPPEWILVQSAISHLYGLFTHTRIIPKLGPLEWIFVTPSHHRVHHGQNVQYLDRNYGVMFIFWDRLFGSFAEEREPVKYGILHPVDTYHPLRIQLRPWLSLVNELVETRGLKDRARVLLHPPGWRPDGTGLTARQMQAREGVS